MVPVNVGVSDTQTAFQHKLTVKCGLGHLHRFTPCSKSSVRCTVEQDWAMMWRLCFVCRCGTLPCIKRDELVDCFNGSPQDHSKHATNCSCTEITNEQGPTQPLSPAAKHGAHGAERQRARRPMTPRHPDPGTASTRRSASLTLPELPPQQQPDPAADCARCRDCLHRPPNDPHRYSPPLTAST